MDDHDLVARLLTGDEAAFKLLVNTYKKMVYNTVLGFVQNIADAEDVTQDVFIKLFENIAKFKGQSKLSTWIYRVSITQATDFLRYRNRKKRSGFLVSMFREEGPPLNEPVDFEHPGVLAENKERAAILFKAINTLPENQKTAFLLQKVQDCSQQQISEVMQLSEGAVESLLSRAKGNLKKQLINYYTDK